MRKNTVMRYKYLILMFAFAIVACGNINGNTHKTDDESSEMTEKQTKPVSFYRELLEEYFDSTAHTLDFLAPESAKIINGWVEEKTKGLIPEIINADVLADLYMVLINALYMKGSWTEPYGNREEGLFNGSACDVLKSTEEIYYENDKATAFGKMINGGYEMIAILPRETNEFSLSELDLEGLLETKTYEYEVNTSIPAFELDYSASLSDVLCALGVTDVFDLEQSDLSGIRDIRDDERLYVSDVIHKTHVKVDEVGFEGAAVTAVLVDATAAMPEEKQKKEVIIDRPFVFMIIDRNTDTAIFTGKVVSLKN